MKTLSHLINNEVKTFAKYTIEARAIPSMIDGLKPVQRLYLYSAIKNKEFAKVSATAGILSEYGYMHGETAAAGAGQLMAASWNNNCPIIEGMGAFGTRALPVPGAARYVYTRPSEIFKRYFLDTELAPKNVDPDQHAPLYYLPTLPMLLINGARGIATGFATNILPRSLSDVTAACQEYIKTGDIKNALIPSFPEFNGSVKSKGTHKWDCIGSYRKNGLYLVITEIPYGIDRETYIKILDKLEIMDLIDSYEDNTKDHFEFHIKLKRATANLTAVKYNSMFHLTKSMTENLTVIDEHGQLKIYDDVKDIIKDFVNFRLGYVHKRIGNKLNQLNTELPNHQNKRDFIQAVLDNKIIFKNKRKDEIARQIVGLIPTANIDQLLKINMISLTKEAITELDKKIKLVEKEILYWKNADPKELYLKDIEP